MLISTISHSIINFIDYIYSDGFFSIKSMSFTVFVLLLVYESCKDYISQFGIENDYFDKTEIGNCKIKDELINQDTTQLEKTNKEDKTNKEEKTETLQLYKLFNSKK